MQITQADMIDYVAGRLEANDRLRVEASIKCSYFRRQMVQELKKLHLDVEDKMRAQMREHSARNAELTAH